MSSRRRTYGGGDGKLGIYAIDSYYVNRIVNNDNRTFDRHFIYSDDGMRNMKLGCKLPCPDDIAATGYNYERPYPFTICPGDNGYIYCIGKYPYNSKSVPHESKIVVYKVDLLGCDYTDPSAYAPYEELNSYIGTSYDDYSYPSRSLKIGDYIYTYDDGYNGSIRKVYDIKSNSFISLTGYYYDLSTVYKCYDIDGQLVIIHSSDIKKLSSAIVRSDGYTKDTEIINYSSRVSFESIGICNDTLLVSYINRSESPLIRCVEIFDGVRRRVSDKNWGYSNWIYNSEEFVVEDESKRDPETAKLAVSSDRMYKSKDSSKILVMMEQYTYSIYPTWQINTSNKSKSLLTICRNMFTQFRDWNVCEFDDFYLIDGNGWGYAVSYDNLNTSQVVGLLGVDGFTDTHSASDSMPSTDIIEL